MRLHIKATLSEDASTVKVHEFESTLDVQIADVNAAGTVIKALRKVMRRELIRRGLLIADEEDAQRLR
jgi:phosphopantetheine adenylyltransferase